MSIKYHTSSTYKPPADRTGNIVLSSHIFQESFPALGTGNGIGGSATVHAQQAVQLDNKCIMLAPSSDHDHLTSVRIPAVSFGFLGQADLNHDEWFERPNQASVAEIIEDISNRGDVLYSHMPISGAISNQVSQSRGNPHVYLGHAWEYLSAQFFPERGLKLLRLLTEYEMIRTANLIVTNTNWEAGAIAKLYSQLPSEQDPQEILNTVEFDQKRIKFLTELIQRDSYPLLTEQEILQKCVANPLGVDNLHFNPIRRKQLRAQLRADFLDSYQWASDTILLGSVGRIHPQKDPCASVDLFHKIYNLMGKPNNIRLILAGPHSIDERGSATGYYKEVLNYLNERHSQIKKFVVFPSGNDGRGTVQADHMNACLDIRLDTSRFETFGLSIAEALASGLPTVAVKNPVYEELYNHNRIIIKEDLDVLAESVVKLLRDPKYYQEYAGVCESVGSSLTWANSVALLRVNALGQFGI